MPARWLFALACVFYLLGPARAGAGESEGAAGLVARPVVALAEAVYPHASALDRSLWSGRIVGAVACAGAVTLTMAAVRRLLPLESSLLLAGMTGLASPIWSAASRSNTTEALASLAVAALLFLSVGSGRLRLAAAPVAAALAMALLPWTPGGFGHLDPVVFAAYLVSPGRGIVFFAPLVLLAAWAAATERGPLGPARSGGIIVLAALAVIACRREPWGPHGFGPTLLAPCVPILAAMASRLSKALVRAGAVVCLPATLAHGAAVFAGGQTWDARRMLLAHPEAAWDFADSPLTDLVFGPPRPDPARFSAAAVDLRLGDHVTREGLPLPWLAYGWERAEPRGVWASGEESWIVLATPPGDYVLTLVASAPRRRGEAQRLVVERPVEPPVEVGFARELWELEPVSIPFRADRNLSILKLRPRHTWMPGHGDVRRLSVFVATLRLRPVGGS